DTAGGGTFMYYFRRFSEPPLSAPSYIRTTFVAGQNQYVNTNLSFNNYWDSERQNLYTYLGYSRGLANYYTPCSQSPSLLGTYRTSNIDLNVMYRQKLTRDSYMGAKYEYGYNGMDSRTPVGVFSSNEVYGLNGGAVSGVGMSWMSLPVEDIFSPKRNFAFELSYTLYSKYFGSQYSYEKFVLDLREYYHIKTSHIFVFESYFGLLAGEVPYRRLLSISDLFRAYPYDKYLDKNMMGIKAEYRLLVFSRMYLSAFLGTGYHSVSVKKFRMNDNLPSYGGGVRFLLDSELNINARLDYVVGRDGKGFMLGVGEGF
ncbi:MAG: hypothetical protein V1647_04055, partial [Pseudomonadota bacterium]